MPKKTKTHTLVLEYGAVFWNPKRFLIGDTHHSPLFDTSGAHTFNGCAIVDSVESGGRDEAFFARVTLTVYEPIT